MTKILVECPQKIASVRVGVLEPLKLVEEAGLCQVRYRDTKDITKKEILWCDVLVCVRGCEYPTLRIVQAAKASGRFLAYFLDDDLLNIPDGNASSNYYRDNKIKVNLTKILELCDVLWTVNHQIVFKYGQYVSRSALLRVPATIRRQPPEKFEQIHILYAGSADHSGLVRELLAPAVQKILEEYGQRVDFTFIGADPNLRHTEGVQYYPYFESYDEYQETVLAGNFSIGLAPVYDTPFYACKYYNKFIEYSSCGIAGIYSNYEPYQEVVTQGENGMMCENTVESWYLAIKQMVDSPQDVQKMAYAGAKILETQFTYRAVAKLLKEQIPEVLSFQGPLISEKDISLPPMRLLFYQERIRLLCRMYGLLAVFVIPLKAIKKIFKTIGKKLRGK
ncbi:glycosyltransferase [Pseudoflavonifractor sp. 524-17]|uniref:glycosyltransferase n=1 Tax=Pseudoflavonifractor sp. 524-17 TaxID=2304577 RepID=UPI00137A5B7E